MTKCEVIKETPKLLKIGKVTAVIGGTIWAGQVHKENDRKIAARGTLGVGMFHTNFAHNKGRILGLYETANGRIGFNYRGGGGSGGGIFVACRTISGSGVLRANGGIGNALPAGS